MAHDRVSSRIRGTACATLANERLYPLQAAGPVDERRFEIDFLAFGAEAYCFTFS
jgi:hypothetical protein